jgi:hypothetical protein
MKFDIDSLLKAGSATFNVDVGMRDDGNPVGFTVMGPGSDNYAAADRAITVLNVKDVRTGKLGTDTESDEAIGRFVDGGVERSRIIVDHCVVDWYGFTTPEGTPLPFSKEHLHLVLQRRPNWTRKLIEAIENEANFV